MQRIRFGARRPSSRTSNSARHPRLRDAANCAVETLERRTLLAGTPITQYHVDNRSSGVNSTETLLTPATVNVNQFGKQFSTPVDGQVYAEPLYIPNLNITGGPQQGVHNVVFVATEHDSLYAIDAHGGNVLWKTSFQDVEDTNIANGAVTLVNPLGATAIAPMPAGETGSGDITVEIGITSTPVIDLPNNALYLIAKSKQTIGANTDHYVQTLYKVNIQNGQVTASTVIGDTRYNGGNYVYRTLTSGATDPYTLGSGSGAIRVNPTTGAVVASGGEQRVYFNAMRQMNRPGLIIDHGTIYTAWASHGDNGPYHGWVLAYNPSTLALTGALNTTPNGGLGGIWQGGGITATDPAGNLYFETGNGTFDGFNTGGTVTGLDANGFPANGNYGDTFMKVSPDPASTPTSQNKNGWGLKVADYFSPFNNHSLDSADTDLGSGGLTILPDAVGSNAHRHLLVGAGKEGKLYLIDRDNMGKFGTTDNVVQTQGGALSGLLNTPAFFFDHPNDPTPSGSLEIIMGYGGGARAFKVSNGAFTATPTSQTTTDFGYLPGSASISANGVTNGILWGVNRNNNKLYAFRADNLATELWDSGMAANNRDQLGSAVKFSVPAVADGQVFVGTANSLVVYGPPVLPTAPPAAPSNLAGTAPNFNRVVLNWQDNSSNEDFFQVQRTLTPDVPGSWSGIGTTSTNINTFTDTNTLAETTYSYRVRATNAFNGGSFSAYSNVFTITTPQAPPTGTGDGLLAQYWNDTTGHLVGNPALTRVDPQVKTDWGNGGPGAPIGTDDFSARWTGRVQAQFSQTYTFYTNSDDGVRLFIKPIPSLTYTPVVDNWTDHAPTENAGTFTMSAGQLYDIEMDFYENGGGAVAQLSWSSTSTPKDFVPQSQLYSGSAPATPGTLTGQATSGTQVDLHWTDNSNIETGYVVERSQAGGPFTPVTAQPLPPNTTSYSDTALNPDTQYAWRVKATNFQADSPYTNTVSIKTPIPPAKPSNAHPTAITSTSISFAWTDNSNNEDGYRLSRSLNGGSFIVIEGNLPPNTTTYTDNGLVPGGEYEYHIQSYNIAGYNDFSGFSTATVPSAPASPTASGGNQQVTLNWTPPAFNGEPTDLTYRVYRGTAANGENATPIATGLTSPTYTDTGLTNGTTYYYKVTAYYQDDVFPVGGESAKSSEIFATPAATAPAPQTLTINGGSPQRSAVTLLNVAFGQPLASADAGAFVVTRTSDNAVFTPIVALATGGQGFDLTFNGTSGASVTNGSLPDGVYVLTVHPEKVHSSGGQVGSSTPVNMPQFFRYQADLDGDGTIGPGDFNILASHFGQTGQTAATGDVDGDGTVGPGDFNILASRFGTSVQGGGGGGAGLVASPSSTSTAVTTTTTKPKHVTARKPATIVSPR